MTQMKKLLGISLLAVTLTGLSGCFAMVATGAATGAIVAHDRRTTGTIVEDHSIELKAYKTIAELDLAGKDTHISVTSYNNNLLLLGQTATTEDRDRVAEAMKDITKVRKIYNEVQVAAPTSLMTRSSDAWISTKLKSQMLLDKTLDPTRVKIVTEDGVVFLMGIVRPEEESTAIDMVRRMKGVKKVVKMFEYINEDEAKLLERS